MMKYANMTDDWLMFQINTVALVLNALYITFYMLYTEDQFNEVLKQLAIGVAVIAIMFNYSKYEDQEVVKWRYGVITTIFMLILLALPLFELVNANTINSAHVLFAISNSASHPERRRCVENRCNRCYSGGYS